MVAASGEEGWEAAVEAVTALRAQGGTVSR